jgi:uncharacterized membrane protein YbhN (UPF0104 family)
MTAAVAARSDQRIPRWLLGVLWVALTIVLIVAARDLSWRRAMDEIGHTQVVWLMIAVAANLFILPLWAVEWRLLVPRTFSVPLNRMFEVVSVTASVLNSVPFFAGEASGVALLIGRGGLSRGAALSVLAMDQLLVGFAKIAVIAAAAVVVPIPGWLRAGILSLLAAMAVLSAVLLSLAHQWASLRERLLRTPSRIRALAARSIAWGTHFDALRDSGVVWRLAALALAKKFAELLGILAVQMAFGWEPSAASALLVLASLSITTLLPVAPANLGVYEATVFATYRYLGYPPETAVGVAILQHLCFLIPALTTGYLMLTMRQLRGTAPRA